MMHTYKTTFIIISLLFLSVCNAVAADKKEKNVTCPSHYSTMQLVTVNSSNDFILRERSKEVTFPLDAKTKKFIADFRCFFAELKGPFNRPPAGLAASQVGVPLRIFMMQIPKEAKSYRKGVTGVVPPTLLINPCFTPVENCGKNKDWEGCFSIPNRMGEVYRYNVIHYEGYDEQGKKISGTATGLLARIIQHEMGHLEGELYVNVLCSDCRFGDLESMMELQKEDKDA